MERQDTLALGGETSEIPEALRDLTRREREVLASLVEGKTDPEIANALSISIRTVNTHVCNLLGKLGVKNRVQAAVLWDRYMREEVSGLSRCVAEKVAQRLVEEESEEAKMLPTERELDVLTLIASGYTNRGIAKALNISERTVAFHVANVLEKLEVGSRTEAVVKAIQQGWLET